MFFHQIAFAIGVLTSSLGGGWSRNFWVCCRGRVSFRVVSLVVPHHESGREVLGRVSLRLSFGMFLVVSDCGCCWKVLRRMLLGLLLGVSMVVLDRRMRCEVLRRVLLECRWWWSEGVLWKVRVLLVMFDCVGGSVVGGGWLSVGVAGRRCPGCCWVSLVVLDRKCRGGCRLWRG